MEKEMRTSVGSETLGGVVRGAGKAAKASQMSKTLKTTSVGSPVNPAQSRVAFERHFTAEFARAGKSPMDVLTYVKSRSKIKDTDGKAVFEMNDVEVPS